MLWVSYLRQDHQNWHRRSPGVLQPFNIWAHITFHSRQGLHIPSNGDSSRFRHAHGCHASDGQSEHARGRLVFIIVVFVDVDVVFFRRYASSSKKQLVESQLARKLTLVLSQQEKIKVVRHYVSRGKTGYLLGKKGHREFG